MGYVIGVFVSLSKGGWQFASISIAKGLKNLPIAFEKLNIYFYMEIYAYIFSTQIFPYAGK